MAANRDQERAGFHHRLYPYMDEFVQYATEQDQEPTPWVVRDRSAALRNERQGRGRALVRVWVASEWEYVNDGIEDE